MMEKIEFPDVGREKDGLGSPQEKLKILMDALAEYNNPKYQEIDPALLEKAIENQLQRIAKLKKEFPELNN